MSRVTLIADFENPGIWKEVTATRNFFSLRFIGRKSHFEFWTTSLLAMLKVSCLSSITLVTMIGVHLKILTAVDSRRPFFWKPQLHRNYQHYSTEQDLFKTPFTPEGPNREASGEELRASRPPGSSHPSQPPLTLFSNTPMAPRVLPEDPQNPFLNSQPYFLGQQKSLQIEDQIQKEYLSIQPIHLQILRRRYCLSVFACHKELHSQTNFRIFWIDCNEHLQLSCFLYQKWSVSCKPFAFFVCVIVLKV